ncbi:MAG TPA: HK97 gp10 family phage protein [Clostridia bacterium]|nr:HK97 gp10 family phage protein [Clostridia bacterium]
MELEVKIDADRLARRFRALGEKVETRAAEAIMSGARVLQAEAKRRAPVDTGMLRRSIAARVVHQGDDVVGQVGTNVHYAIHVEYGHRLGKGKRYVPGRYFLKGAATAKRNAAIGAVVANLLKGE